MLVSSVIDAEQELDVSHGFASAHLELLLELQVGYLARRPPARSPSTKRQDLAGTCARPVVMFRVSVA